MTAGFAAKVPLWQGREMLSGAEDFSEPQPTVGLKVEG
jgi:hypothetical protein